MKGLFRQMRAAAAATEFALLSALPERFTALPWLAARFAPSVDRRCAAQRAASLQQGNARIAAGGCQSFCLSVR
jgi:hypothetical protein